MFRRSVEKKNHELVTRISNIFYMIELMIPITIVINKTVSSRLNSEI